MKVMEPYILVHFVNKFLLFCFVLFSFLSLSLYSILKVLEVVAPFKHFNKLKEFVAMKLPAGFPVRIGLFCFCSSFEISPIVSAEKKISRLVSVVVVFWYITRRATFKRGVA